MKTTKTIMLLLFVFAISFANAQDKEPELEINGFVRNYTGVLLDGSTDFSIV